jgi:hypothetical protein
LRNRACLLIDLIGIYTEGTVSEEGFRSCKHDYPDA